MVTPDAASAHEHEVAHEASDIGVGTVGRILAIMAAAAGIFVAIVFGLGAWLQQREDARQSPLTPAQQAVLVPPEPRLQPEPWGDLRRLEAREEQVLGGYGWLTPARDRVRVPLQRAQSLMVGRSLDAPPP